MKAKIYKKHNKGFTLIEITLYMGLLSVLLGLLVSSLFLINQARIKSHMLMVIEQEGQQIARTLQQAIKDSREVNLPTIGTNSSQLSLSRFQTSLNPTVFALNNNKIVITESNAANLLSSNQTIVQNLLIQNVSTSGKPGLIRFQFTIASSSELSNRYQFSKTFYGSEVIRTN